MIHGKGIEPDIVLEESEVKPAEGELDSDVKQAYQYLLKQ